MQFFVPGVPRPQGSKRAFVVKGKPVLTETGGQAHKDWRAVVALAGHETWADRPTLDGPVSVRLIFHLPQPKTSKGRSMPISRPDVDKLARSVLDALTHICWRDDAQIVDLWVKKLWATPVGVHIYIAEYGEEMAA